MISHLIEAIKEEPRIKVGESGFYIFKDSSLGIHIDAHTQKARIFCLGTRKTISVEKLLEYGMCEKWIRDFIIFNMHAFRDLERGR